MPEMPFAEDLFRQTPSGPIGLWLLGLIVEAIALALIPFVLLQRKDPGSTIAWILALVFLPGAGATLFLLFGRDRVRLPVQWKREADDRLRALRHHRHRPRLSEITRELALERHASPIERELFRLGVVLAGVEPSQGNAITLLNDGEATYAAIGRAIDAAERHVYAEYYLVQRGKASAWLGERLMAAARRGVSAKLLLDGYGSFWIGRRWVRALRAAGVEVAFFLPARLLLLQPMNLRNHRKIVVVDGHTGFTGGINIMDEYLGEDRRGRPIAPWRDTHLAVRGPATQSLCRVFELDWHFATRQPIRHDEVDPTLETSPGVSGASGVSVIGDAISVTGATGTPIALVDRVPHGEATVAIVQSGPDVAGAARETIHRLFFSAIGLARSRVYITTPYFIPDRSITVALATAALRGVDVRLLFPSRSNHPVVFLAGRSFYEELLEAGVRIYEYGPGMIHAKTMVVDDRVSLVGSANMDLRSFRLNFEVHAVVRDEATARELEASFLADLEASRMLDAEAFRRRGRRTRMAEGAARLLSPLM
jgi:cardiolipin synthase A/B